MCSAGLFEAKVAKLSYPGSELCKIARKWELCCLWHHSQLAQSSIKVEDMIAAHTDLCQNQL